MGSVAASSPNLLGKLGNEIVEGHFAALQCRPRPVVAEDLTPQRIPHGIFQSYAASERDHFGRAAFDEDAAEVEDCGTDCTGIESFNSGGRHEGGCSQKKAAPCQRGSGQPGSGQPGSGQLGRCF